MLAEVVGGFVTGSLALLADAAHMLTDVAGLALALLAIRIGERPASPQRTYGYLRLEILSALVNSVVLLLLTVYILYEAYQRFLEPVEIASTPMLIVASIGLAVNLASMRLLAGGSSDSLNVQGAYFEVLSDMLGSIGVIAASLIVMWTGWTLADPLIGAGIGVFIVPRTWTLMRQAVHILMEGSPAGMDLSAVEQALATLPGVAVVHDLHVWTITSGFDALSGHLVVRDVTAAFDTVRAARALLKERFAIEHVTLQVEDEQFRAEERVLQV